MTDTPMTPDLDAIRERWATAQSGPWTVDSPYRGDDEQANILGSDGCMVAAYVDPEEQEAIAAAPTDVAALMAWGEHLAAENERLTAEAQRREDVVAELGRHLKAAITDADIERRRAHTEVERLRAELASATGLGERMTLLWDKACGQRDAFREEVTRLRPMEAALGGEHAALEMSEAEVQRLREDLRASALAELELIGERNRARGAAVALEQQNAAALALHQPIKIYEPCEHRHTDEDVESGLAQDVNDVGYVCADGHMYTICSACCTDAAPAEWDPDFSSEVFGVSQECAEGHWKWHTKAGPICPTAAALNGSA